MGYANDRVTVIIEKELFVTYHHKFRKGIVTVGKNGTIIIRIRRLNLDVIHIAGLVYHFILVHDEPIFGIQHRYVPITNVLGDFYHSVFQSLRHRHLISILRVFIIRQQIARCQTHDG